MVSEQACRGLSENDKVRLTSMIEDVDFASIDEFKEKVGRIRDRYFEDQDKDSQTKDYIESLAQSLDAKEVTTSEKEGAKKTSLFEAIQGIQYGG